MVVVVPLPFHDKPVLGSAIATLCFLNSKLVEEDLVPQDSII